MSKKGKIIFSLVVLVIFATCFSIAYIASLRKNIEQLEGKDLDNRNTIVSIEFGHNLAVKIMSKSVWYILDEETISSELNGCGEVVKLDQKLKTVGSRMLIKHPERNKEIHFFYQSEYHARHHEGSYTVAFGFLWYVY